VAVRIRLTRVGMTKQPTYRFVVTDSRNARDGRSLATIGHYNPRTEPIEINVDSDKAKEWMSRGAKPSETVDRLFRRVGVLPERTDRPTGPARGPKKGDKTTKAAKRAAAAEAAAKAPPQPPAEAPAAEAPAEASAETAAEAAASEVAAEAPEMVEEPATAEASAEPGAAESAPAESEEEKA
jgi:small subunit ribosomal protein S16